MFISQIPFFKAYWGSSVNSSAFEVRSQPSASWPLAERVPCEPKKSIVSLRSRFSGVSRARATHWCTQVGVSSIQSWDSLASVKQHQLRRWRRQHQALLLDAQFKKTKLDRISRWLATKHQKAYRLLCGYPLRGQRTRTNRKTARKTSRQWIARLRQLTASTQDKSALASSRR